MLSGEPCLLIGPPGTAKTELVGVIGSALREHTRRLAKNNDNVKVFDYQVYDASKLNFEDLFGYPSVADLKKDPPEVKYIPTPSSIWGKELVAFDELNRCAEDRQSNLFELIRSRKLHGNQTGNRFIYGTMNPFGDEGTVEMSDALVDRFTYYIRLDNFAAMDTKDRKAVIGRVGNCDGVGFSYWGGDESDLHTDNEHINEKLADIGKEIGDKLKKGMEVYNKMKETIQPSVVQMVDKVVEAMSKAFSKESEKVRQETSISGRRAAAILRGIMATRAMEIALKKDDESVPDMMSTIINTIKLCLPIGIGGTLDENILSRANALIDDTVKTIWHTIDKNYSTEDIDRLSDALSTDNPLKILSTVLMVDTTDLTRNSLMSRILDPDKYIDKDGNKDNDLFKGFQALIYVLQKELPGFVPPHLNVNITPAEMEQCTSRLEVTNTNSPRHMELFKLYTEKYKSEPIIYYVLRLSSMFYFKDRLKTDDQAALAILDTFELCDAIKASITYHKQNGTKTTNPNNQETEKLF